MDINVINGMARALFVCAWADKEERAGRSHSGEELTDIAPLTPEIAKLEAARLYGKIEAANRCDFACIMRAAFMADGKKEAPDNPGTFAEWFANVETNARHSAAAKRIVESSSRERLRAWHLAKDVYDRERAESWVGADMDYVHDFGWCLAMQAMGHGVSWYDDHPEFQINDGLHIRAFVLPHCENPLDGTEE